MSDREKTKGLTANHCSLCGSTKVSREDFDSEASWREFKFSRMCQECQDKNILERG